MSKYEEFTDRLVDLVQGDRRQVACELTERYWTAGYTGSFFHVFADDEHPNEITERDILAVSMLSVTIPAGVAIWLRGDEGRSAVTDLLRAIPTDIDIWDSRGFLDPDRELSTLWHLLANASWPSPKRGNGMGRTKLSKLLAAKRPRLVPIYDSLIADLLPTTPNHWRAFEHALSDPDRRSLLSDVSASGAPEGLSLLRRLDATLWMVASHQLRS